ncbi:Protein CBG24917 [Caenorhabditis briggsae]|uniref:Protein CBG24917 n=1 Tax=Caenorhabditis briggsae TaxID=6238 RepID=A8WLR7_CAEBR|nr:Protein CBG24917 [Caenorhabditis briggsae]CAP21413.2 Protein CBG24917 [Caenorhabditis briggsae]
MDSDVQNGDLDKKAMMTQRYADTAAIFEEFFKSTAHGDLTAIYRNRPCYSSILSVEKLTRCAIDAFVYFPSARPAIYHYTGMMIHECVHHWFNKKENVAQSKGTPLKTLNFRILTRKLNISAIDTTSAQEATSQLLNYYIRFFTEANGKGGLEEILQVRNSILTVLKIYGPGKLCAELSSKNAGRPATAQVQQNGEVLAILKSNELIDKLLSLMNMVVTTALNENPDGCMRALFESSRHGQHFSWIWLHIATFLQGTIMTHLLESGAEQFKTYATEINNRKAVQSSGPAVLNIIQTEYEHKFRAISEVFNFLMARRNPELQEAVSQLIVDSLDSKVEKSGEKIEKSSTNRLGFAFFFKLVTCSLKTLQILVNSNCHLSKGIFG